MSLILVKRQKPKPRRRKPGPRKRRQQGEGILGDLGKLVAKEVIKEIAPKAIKAVSKQIFGKGVVLAGGRQGRGLKLAGQGRRRRKPAKLNNQAALLRALVRSQPKRRRRRKPVTRKVPQFILI